MPLSRSAVRIVASALAPTMLVTLFPSGVSADPGPVSAKLAEAGAGCKGRVDAIAATALQSTKAFSSESVWRIDDPAKHMVSVIVGQSFGADAKVPHGVTGIVAAPSPAGGRCDGYTFQVLPSSLSCDAIQSGVKGGRAADLAGLPLIRAPGRQFILMPAPGSKGCVVVAFHTDY